MVSLVINKKNKKVITQDIIVGVNIIVHNLNLQNPKGFNITILDNNDNQIIISNYQNLTKDSFEFVSATLKTNCTITIS